MRMIYSDAPEEHCVYEANTSASEGPWENVDRCIAELKEKYPAPSAVDMRLQIFDYGVTVSQSGGKHESE